jgi:hypothetical protein
MNRRFGGAYHLHLLARWFIARLIFNPEMEVIRSSETSVHVRTTLRYMPEDGNFYNYRYENLISFK